MTSIPERQSIISLIQQANRDGARLAQACAEAGICLRTYRRWYRAGSVRDDRRPTAIRTAPTNKLSAAEQEQIVELCNSPAYSQLPPSQIVPDLLDKGVYIASESTFYRWDITYCPSIVRGQFYYLYMFEDLYSRKIVGYEVHETESGEYAAQLLQRSQLREQCLHKPLVLHSDNGAPMKAQTMKAKLEELSVMPSYSRPRVSNDNAFVESLFRVLKYRPQWPSRGFTSLDEARLWVDRFVRWYNTEHRHSKLRFVTPEQRHNGEDAVLLEQRKRVLEQAKQSMPSRWGTRPVRNCEPVGPTTLNPETELPMRQAA